MGMVPESISTFLMHFFSACSKNKFSEYKYPVFSSNSNYKSSYSSNENKSMDYSKLKSYMLQQTQNFGFFTVFYSFIAISPKSSIFTSIGLVASLNYLHLLIRDIESVVATDSTPMLEALEAKCPAKRRSQTLLLAYSFAFRPRLLLPTSLAFSCWLYNQLIEYPDLHIGISEQLLLT